MSTPGITMDGRDLLFIPPVNPSKLVKDELGGRWDEKKGGWRLAPTSLAVIRLVELYGVNMLKGAPEEVSDLMDEEWGFKRFSKSELKDAQRHPSWNELYDFQKEGVEYLAGNPHGAGLCGLSWGLGKAATAIVAANLCEAKRVLVLAPLTLAPAWLDEIETWGLPCATHRATAQDRAPASEGWTIANHEVIQEVVLRTEDGETIQPEWVTNAREVKRWIGIGPKKRNAKGKEVPARKRIVRVRRDYLEVDWDLIIVDESVIIKNREAVKADVLKNLRKKSDPLVFLLSASPTTKWRDDLFRQLSIAYPRAFTSYWRFAEFFCVVDKEGWGWTIEGDRPDRDPHHYLRDLIWMKSEEEAGIELPEYHESVLLVEPGKRQRQALDSMLNDWIVELDEDPEALVADTWLARTTRVQQITSNLGALPKPSGGGFYKPDSAKARALLDLIRQGDVQMPLLAWTWFIESTELLRDTIKRTFPELEVTSVTGEDTRAHKEEMLQKFKDGELNVLVLQMGVGKFGHTFTKTRSIYYHDRTFDSDAYIQSRRRVRRIGLKHRPTLIIPKIKNSADQLIDANLDGKLRSVAQLSNANLAELLRGLEVV